MFVIEYVLDDIARKLGQIRSTCGARTLRHTERNVTPGMTVEDNVAPAIVDQLAVSSRYRERRAAIRAWNAISR